MDAQQTDKKILLEQKEIELSPNLFIGRGRHKECYKYPGKPTLCIKTAYNEGGTVDLVREINYLNTLIGKNLDYSILPFYYGTVKTNKGIGYVYEFITDFDGRSSMTVQDILKNTPFLEKHFDCLVNELKNLRKNLLDNRIITMGLFPENIIVQRIDPQKSKLRIVNDMGSSTLIHLDYYFHFFAKKHIEKRWERFTQNLIRHHHDGRFPSPLVLRLAEKIR